MSGGGYKYNRKEAVKVVIISTQYVETDARSFKSVVQKLTGKDSGDDHEEAPSAHRPNLDKIRPQTDGSSLLMRDASFKDFDRLLREMPPIHDLWSDYQ